MRHIFIILPSLLLIAQTAQAVTGVDIQTRYSLVGVISAEREDGKSIVVLKDKRSQRSVTLTEGQALPSDANWIIGSVYRNAVIVQKGQEQIRVTYAGTNYEEQVNEPSSIAEARVVSQKVQVLEESSLKRLSNYDDHNNVQFLDNLVTNGEALERSAEGEYRSESLQEYERHLEQELRRVRQEQQASELEGNPEASTYGSEQEQQDPVFNDLPDGPTYFE